MSSQSEFVTLSVIQATSLQTISKLMASRVDDFKAFVAASNPGWKPGQVAQVGKQFADYFEKCQRPEFNDRLELVGRSTVSLTVGTPNLPDLRESMAKIRETQQGSERMVREVAEKTVEEHTRITNERIAAKKAEWTLVVNKRKQAKAENRAKAHQEKLAADKRYKETGTRRTPEKEAEFKQRLEAKGRKYIPPAEFKKIQETSRKANAPITVGSMRAIIGKKFVAYTDAEKKAHQAKVAQKSHHGRYFSKAERDAYKAKLAADRSAGV